MLKQKEVREVIENEGIENRPEALAYFKDSEVSRKGWNYIMGLESESEMHISNLLFASGMYPFGNSVDVGDKYSTTFLPDNDRETIQIDDINMTPPESNRPDTVNIREGNWVHKYNIFPPRDDELLPTVQIPGRRVNNSREVNADILERIWADKGADAVKEYIENKGKKFKNGKEEGTISVYNDIEYDTKNRTSFCSLVEELGAVAGMVWMIKRWGVSEYLLRMFRHQSNKNSTNSWTCSSCRYCKNTKVPVKNAKGGTDEQKVYKCTLSDVVIGAEWSDCWDGMFEDISIRVGDKREIISCPYNDKNYKSKKLNDWITEKPKPFLPITRFGDSLFVLLDGVVVEITLLMDDIRAYFDNDDSNTDSEEQTADNDNNNRDDSEKLADKTILSEKIVNRLTKLPKLTESMALKILEGIKSDEINDYEDCRKIKGIGKNLTNMMKVYREFDLIATKKEIGCLV